MKTRHILISLILALAVLPFAACGHHHGGGSLPPSPAPNPAAYTYTATVVAEHQPGFFCCANFMGRILLGTYQDYHNKMHCQLCELANGKIKVLHTFDGESVYHIRVFGNYAILPIEQGNLYRYDGSGIHFLKARKYHMGFYDFCWLDGHNYSIEKKNIYPPNVVAIYKDLTDWFLSTAWKGKEMIPFGNKLYVAATGLNNHTEAAIVEIDPNTKAVHIFKSYRWCWTGTLAAYDNAVWTTLSNGLVVNTRGEEYQLEGCGWFVGKINNILFATSGGEWRGKGPSHLYVFDIERRCFVKKLDFPDAEPWYICQGPSGNQFYLVTRNEKEGNLGRVYLIERHK